MFWIYLLLVGLFEIGFVLGLKYSDGFIKFWLIVVIIILVVISLYLLIQVLWIILVGIGYVIWIGIGVLGVVMLGIFLFGDSVLLLCLVCIGLIVVGVIGLKFVFG